MKKSVKLSDSVHALVLISTDPFHNLTSARLAESIKTNPSFVRQIMSKLKQAGIIESVTGHPQPKLAIDPKSISLLDIYRAVEGDAPLLQLDTNINPECGPGVNIQLSLKDYYNVIQQNIEKQMAAIDLQSIIDNYEKRLENPKSDYLQLIADK
ncbi:Rrf2 family transcriptional regulator [Companilactobacillus kedongensis]|uniref:Rrf2 family transcriptional regulator n=1 Tax=Companilactobacillus kedongensis TaxID=2486004 RepID=UPI000F7A78C2|nr:Rrf2 family transcriptional regulator [Companilactobacillus kedongensis]